MVKQFFVCLLFLLTALFSFAAAEQAGSIRGMIYDSDFDAPLGAAKVTIAETEQTAVTSDEGNYVLNEIRPGAYTLVFSKEGYTRQVRADVVVSPGQMTEVNVSLSGEFEEMEEFIVQDVQIGTGTEAALLDLRMESPSLMDSISADLMSRAGASDAASALKLVSGATVQDGKYAVIRGLPDRYVNSQMNGIRLPTADVDKRAVQLDQFPSAIIESIQVSKTFSPDQQGDASGGAVNLVLKGIPSEDFFSLSTQTGFNTQVRNAGSDFLSYRKGGVDTWAKDDGGRDRQFNSDGHVWDGSVAVSPDGAPMDYKWSVSAGRRIDFEDFTFGAMGSLFYERGSSHYEDGINDKNLIRNGQYFPQTSGDNPVPGNSFTTSLFDVTRSSRQVQWGGMGVVGIETENHALNLSYIYTRSAEDEVTRAVDTRGKSYFYPGYDPADTASPGYMDMTSAPYRITETLEYTERTTHMLQLSGRHTLPDPELAFGNIFRSLNPVLDWSISHSSAGMYQPDKRQASWVWQPTYPIIPGLLELPAAYMPSEGNINEGNIQRIWKEIHEDSSQYAFNFKLPFEQWSGDEGFIKFGIFSDEVIRTYEQVTYQNDTTDLPAEGIPGDWGDIPSYYGYPLHRSPYDIDYDGEQSITAWYYQTDLPLTSWFKVLGGTRFETTELSIKNTPFDPGSARIVYNDPVLGFVLEDHIEKADVQFEQKDVLPSIGFEFKPFEQITLRGCYSETVARQTFKELSPILQAEYVGADQFVGNPDLKMSALKNYDLRLDYAPYDGGLISVSYFYKKITDPIEYVRRYLNSPFTYPVNYPEGELSGYEIEIRQELGRLWSPLEGVGFGANATFIQSEVTMPDDEVEIFRNINEPMTKRDMMNAPEHLYNFYLTYDMEKTGTLLALFYTIRGDTLVAGAGQAAGNLIPSIYETEYGTLNFSLSQDLGDIWKLKFQAKNLLDPAIETVYRSDRYGDQPRTSHRKGMDFSISLSATF